MRLGFDCGEIDRAEEMEALGAGLISIGCEGLFRFLRGPGGGGRDLVGGG